MDIKIHRAVGEDYEKVIKLYGEFVEDTKRYTNLDNDSYLKAIDDPNFYIDLAVSDDIIIGFITYSIRTVVRYPKPIMEVEEFYVSPNHRRGGVGRKLFQNTLDFSKETNCQYVFLASSKDRPTAHKFYKSFDFDEYALHFRRQP
ncbi:MAG: GNAT family N-acetyltransferase [Patescibacteria group bacterium]